MFAIFKTDLFMRPYHILILKQGNINHYSTGYPVARVHIEMIVLETGAAPGSRSLMKKFEVLILLIH